VLKKIIFLLLSGLLLLAASAQAADPSPKPKIIMNPAPTTKDWHDLAKLPDWSGVWNPNITDQDAQIKTNMPPWTPIVSEQINFMLAEEKAGRPPPLFANCLPEGMPAWMLVTHNALEIIFSPGRVTMLGESDSGRMRRIYTDGRPHPEDPDPTFHGHSIGYWEGEVLVVDTIGVLPQTYIAINEAAGIPNNGDMHIKERIYLKEKDILHFDLEITAPKVMTKPYKTTRIFFRQRGRIYDIVEGVCSEGYFKPGIDKYGNDIFIRADHAVGGNRIPPK
jgi:hypothetical protein